MTTGVVIDKQTADGEERYLVRTALYAVPALEAWAKSAIGEALASVLVAKYNTQRSQYAPNLVRAQSKLNEYQQIIGRESARPVRPFDPMDEHYNDTTQWQNVALLRHAEKKLPEAEQAVAQAAQAVGAFSYMSNVEKLKKRQAQLDKNKRYADMARFIERWLSPRDCADFDVGDAVLVVALDFVGERYVLHPKKIERDYIQEINNAYVSYAQATISNRHAKYHVDAIDELIDAENKKPPLPLGPYQDLGLVESLVVQIDMCDYQLAGLLPVLEKYQAELQAASAAKEPTEALQHLVSQLAEYRDELVDKRSDYTLALSEQIARPEPQRGQYRDANYLNGLNQQRADHEQTIAQSQAEIDQAQAELDEAKAYAIARAGEDTQAKGYRQINKISTVSRAIGTDPKAWFVNEALKYGANKWKPFFITGEVTAAQGSTITLAPDAVKPAASGQTNFAPLGLDQPTQIQLANNNYSYEVGDHAIIKINNPETREFEPFGWVKGARCGFYKFGKFEHNDRKYPQWFNYGDETFNVAPGYFETWDGITGWRYDASTGIAHQTTRGVDNGVTANLSPWGVLDGTVTIDTYSSDRDYVFLRGVFSQYTPNETTRFYIFKPGDQGWATPILTWQDVIYGDSSSYMERLDDGYFTVFRDRGGNYRREGRAEVLRLDDFSVTLSLVKTLTLTGSADVYEGHILLLGPGRLALSYDWGGNNFQGYVDYAPRGGWLDTSAEISWYRWGPRYLTFASIGGLYFAYHDREGLKIRHPDHGLVLDVGKVELLPGLDDFRFVYFGNGYGISIFSPGHGLIFLRAAHRVFFSDYYALVLKYDFETNRTENLGVCRWEDTNIGYLNGARGRALVSHGINVDPRKAPRP